MSKCTKIQLSLIGRFVARADDDDLILSSSPLAIKDWFMLNWITITIVAGYQETGKMLTRLRQR